MTCSFTNNGMYYTEYSNKDYSGSINSDLHSADEVFESGSPYENNQICTKEFYCDESVGYDLLGDSYWYDDIGVKEGLSGLHFKFNRFSLGQGNDYLAIGPSEDYNDELGNFTNFKNVLKLHGEQETGVWVYAQSISNVDISTRLRVYFFRKSFEK